MKIAARKHVSFPVVVWYVPETGLIHLARPTDASFQATVGPDADAPDGHPTLFRALSRALREGGEGFAEPPAKYN